MPLCSGKQKTRGVMGRIDRSRQTTGRVNWREFNFVQSFYNVQDEYTHELIYSPIQTEESEEYRIVLPLSYCIALFLSVKQTDRFKLKNREGT